jgi:integrase
MNCYTRETGSKIDPYTILSKCPKGFFYMSSVKIYHDGKECADCGGKFSEKFRVPSGQKGLFYEVPMCQCGQVSNSLMIAAYVLQENGIKARVKIRHSKDGHRLTDINDCIYVLRRIQEEIDSNSFESSEYVSAKSRLDYNFQKIHDLYIAHFEDELARGEISPAGMNSKRKYARLYLPFFKNYDIRLVSDSALILFRQNFKSTKSQLFMTLGSLKTFMRWSRERRFCHAVPEFGMIQKSRERQIVMRESEGLEILAKAKETVAPKYYRMYCLLLEYPVRPCDLRAVRVDRVDLSDGEHGSITFDRHISEGVDIAGRKSRKEGELYASVTLPLTAFTRRLILEELNDTGRVMTNPYLFQGYRSEFVSETAFNRFWREAREAAGYKKTPAKKYDVYEFKHLGITRLYELTNDIMLCAAASGVDPETIRRKYLIKNQKQINLGHFADSPSLKIV